jgi:hypothetical protein
LKHVRRAFTGGKRITDRDDQVSRTETVRLTLVPARGPSATRTVSLCLPCGSRAWKRQVPSRRSSSGSRARRGGIRRGLTEAPVQT